MDLVAVMQEVADRLDTITGLRVFQYPPPEISPPAAMVVAPEGIDRNLTYGRTGVSKIEQPIVLAIARMDARSAWKQIAAFCSGTGPQSVCAVLEAAGWSSCDVVRVPRIEFDAITIGSVDYLAAIFHSEISGSGV